MKSHWAGVLPVALLTVGLPIAALGARGSTPANRDHPVTVWFLTIQDRIGRIGSSAKTPTIYNNPLDCAVGTDDCNVRGIAATNGSLWLPDANYGLRRIDPRTGRAVNGPSRDRYSSAPVVWDGRLWFTDIDRTLVVKPPATRVAMTVRVSNVYSEALAPSPHYLWIAGSGSTRDAAAAVARIDRSGRLAGRFALPISGEVAPQLAALDDRTAYVVVTPESAAAASPSRLFRLTIGPRSRPAVEDLGALSFGPGGIAAFGSHVWVTDVNAPRIVELGQDGGRIGAAQLDAPGDGQLVGAAGRLWYLGTSPDGQGELEVIDPRSGTIESTTPIRLPGTDRVAAFTVTDLRGGSSIG